MKRELKEFIEFKKIFRFEYKELVQNEQGVFWNDVCIEDSEKNKIFETEEFINIGYNAKNSISKILSNLYPYSFKFRGKRVASIEGVLQGVKYKDKKIQNAILSYNGIDAYHTRAIDNVNSWRGSGLLYWQGKPMKRNSMEYENFVDELYLSASKNVLYKNALLSTGDKYLLHHIGNPDKTQTVLTRYELERELAVLRAFLRTKNK